MGGNGVGVALRWGVFFRDDKEKKSVNSKKSVYLQTGTVEKKSNYEK